MQTIEKHSIGPSMNTLLWLFVLTGSIIISGCDKFGPTSAKPTRTELSGDWVVNNMLSQNLPVKIIHMASSITIHLFRNGHYTATNIDAIDSDYGHNPPAKMSGRWTIGRNEPWWVVNTKLDDPQKSFEYYDQVFISKYKSSYILIYWIGDPDSNVMVVFTRRAKPKR